MKSPFQLLVRLSTVVACQITLLGQAPDYNDLVSLWRLSGNAADALGAHNATFVGQTAYEPGPRPDTQAAVLTGGSYLNAGKGIAFNATDSFSVTAWMKGPMGQDAAIIGRMLHGGSHTGWQLHVGTPINGSGPGRLNVWLIDTFGPNYNQINSPDVVLDDTWHHVAFTYDGSYFAEGVKIYVDGVDATGEASVDLLDFGSTILAADVDLNLGSRDNGILNFTGSLYEVSVWNVALSPENIAYIQVNGLQPPVLIESFVAEPGVVFSGTPTTLSWTTDPGATLTLEPGIGDVTPITVDGEGSAQVSPEIETVYTLTATQGARNETRTVTVGIRPLITSFSATQLEVPNGSPTVLSWRVHPEADVTLQPGIGDVTALTSQGYGRIVATPNIDTTYILQVNRMGLTGEVQLDIRVVEPPASAPPNLDHLISYWPLNGTLDDALSANPGEFLPQASYGPGLDLETQAALFNGSSYITVGQDIALDSADAFSVTAWIAGPLGQDSAIIGRMQQGGTYTGWELHVGTGAGGSGAGRLNVWLINAFGSDFLQVNSPAIVLDNSWHHVAFTYDGSYLGSGVRIYVDGVDATGETSADTLFSSFLAENVDLNLGSRQNGAFHNFIGSLARMSIWQGVLGSENIAHIYLFGVGIEPPAAITLSGADFVPPGTFLFTWNSLAGQTYRIESSADLVQWTLVVDNYPAGGATGPSTVYSDAAATDATHFYRVRPQP